MESLLTQRLGACVRSLRQQSGLSQVEFAEKCGFYQTYLSRVENGQANPSLNAIEVIANSFGLTVFALFDLIRDIKLSDLSAQPGAMGSKRAGHAVEGKRKRPKAIKKRA